MSDKIKVKLNGEIYGEYDDPLMATYIANELALESPDYLNVFTNKVELIYPASMVSQNKEDWVGSKGSA